MGRRRLLKFLVGYFPKAPIFAFDFRYSSDRLIYTQPQEREGLDELGFYLMSLVTVFTAFNPMDAQVIRSRLEAAARHPEVSHELSALSLDGYALAAGGILVRVPAEEEAAARELIAARDE